ncbi:hypothetical protein B0J13DRAFT_555969 [Dactylonectria estremocensis]|uniref:Uncharacterized protein n=1 Tax=Dactylonectria estremocensis TaxID=1079267 RepID=A0A9P9ERC5_9HYPO|nr:hypothetical protein B0J13DRAFT_555969 [Dactylonectria estremocensis]
MDVQHARLFGSEGNLSLIGTIRSFANEHPESFLDYLRVAWERDGAQAAKMPDVLTSLKSILVMCEDGKRRPLSTTYLPGREMLFLRGKYMLPDEIFPFLKLQKPWTRDSWAFLESYLGVGAQESLDFYLDILKAIKDASSGEEDVEFPHRVLELYLRIAALCGLDGEEGGATQQTREAFEDQALLLWDNRSWARASDCFLGSSHKPGVKCHILPLNPAWKASDTERAEVTQFFQHTLRIANTYSRAHILEHLDKIREWAKPGSYWVTSMARRYGLVRESVKLLSDDDARQLKSSFINEAYIAVQQDNSLQWYKQSDCVWSWGLIIADSGRIDLSEQYKELETFFTGFLGIERYGAAYNELVESTLLDVSMETIKQLLFSLSASILEHGHLLNPGRFLSSKVLPVRQTNGQVRLNSPDTDFYIVDRKFCQCFSERVPILDFTPHEVWLLEPLLVWADLESRYLSWNVADTTYLKDPAPELLTGRFTGAKARGLIRIASHFRSPRAKNQGQRQSLLRKLERTKFFRSRGICRQLTLERRSSHDATYTLSGQLHIEEGEEELKIYVPHDQAAQDLSVTSLPRALVVWLMGDPDSGLTERVNEVAVSLVKSISNAEDALINRVLDEEEVVKLEDLDVQADVG